MDWASGSRLGASQIPVSLLLFGPLSISFSHGNWQRSQEDEKKQYFSKPQPQTHHFSLHQLPTGFHKSHGLTQDWSRRKHILSSLVVNITKSGGKEHRCKIIRQKSYGKLNALIQSTFCCCSVAELCPTLWPYGLQHARPPHPSQSPKIYPDSYPFHQWCHPAIS